MSETTAELSPWRSLVPVVALAIGASSLTNTLRPGCRWDHHAFHAALEGFGAFAALTVGLLILLLRKYDRLEIAHCWLASGLIGMGLLDGFHAAAHAGRSFVWLHSAATFTGGVLFACVWLPDAIATRRGIPTLLLVMFLGSTALGVFSVTSPGLLPTMRDEHGFTFMAKASHVVGGSGFLAATLYFVARRRHPQAPYAFTWANQCLLLAIAAILFHQSVLWDADWWLGHGLRFLAYVVVLAYFFSFYHRGQAELQESYDLLQQRVEESTGKLVQANKDLKKPITQRQRAEQEFQETMERQGKLNRLQQALLGSADLAEKLKTITDYVVETFDADFCRIWITRPGDSCKSRCIHAEVTDGPHLCRYRDRCLHLMAGSGRYTHIDGEVHRRVPFGCYKIGRVAAGQDRKFLTNQAATDPRVHNHDWVKQLGLVSFAGYQLSPPGGQTIGVLALFSKHAIAPQDDALLESLANTTAQVIHRAQAEEQIQRLAMIVEQAGEGIAVASLDGTLQFVNAAWSRMHGYKTNDELIGKHLSVFHTGQQMKTDVIPFNEQVERSGYNTGEVGHLRRDETPFPTEMTVISLKDHRGKPTGLIAFATDITERKKMEEEKRAHLALEQERNHLQEAVRALERVLGVVGHELRTPLAGVRAMSEFLLREDARQTEEFDTFVHGIHEQVVRMAGMVNDLVEVARLNSGTAKWNWSEIHLREICQEALGTIRPVVDQGGVNLTLQVKPRKLTMRGDAGAIHRLVVNLLSNAQKHTTAGSISVRATGLMKEDRPWVKIEVRDTGEGMPAEIAQRLGVAFALNSGTVGERHVRGSGLGLAICKGIAAAHGGMISLASRPGQGTAAKVLLRADLKEAQAVNNAPDIVCEVQK